MIGPRIGDEPLAPADVVAAARGGRLELTLSPTARARMAHAQRTVEAVAVLRPVYGRTTGVGANRDVEVEEDLRGHTLRLLCSHAGEIGDPLPDEVTRATILIRLAQMATGGGGHRPEVADALARVLEEDPLPVLHDLGGIGTGDLTVLAQLGLALREREDFALAAGDALPLMSSNAATLAVAALVWSDARELLDAGLGVAAVTFHALRGSEEAYGSAVAAGRPLPGVAEVCARMRALAAGAAAPARLQDPFGLRCLPQVAGALLGSLDGLHDGLEVEINAAAENPLVAGEEVLHHGGFHAAACALALDTLRLALVPFASLSTARLSHLMAPELTGLTPFLAEGAAGSSGLLIMEYLAADAVARLRAEAAPAVLGGAVISRGLEEHASFAWLGAWQARRALGHLRTTLALEWVAAERALRIRDVPGPPALAPVRALAESFDRHVQDRPIGADVERAARALPELARVVATAG